MKDESVPNQTSLFRFLPAEHQERVRALFRKVSYDFGDVIVRQGDPADAFYILSTGRARVIKTTARGEEIALNVLRPGSEFGESALLAAEPRTASVRCSTMVEALRLSREDFTRLVGEFPELRGYLETTQRYRTLHGFLYEFSNFGRLPEAALSQLIQRLTPVTFSAGQRILTQGDPAGPMYVVQSGKVRVFEGGNGKSRSLAFYREGGFFGELSILNGSPRAASAEAVTDCTLLALPPETLLDLRRQFPEFEKLLAERLAQYHFDREARVPLDFATELLPAETQVAAKIGPEQIGEEPPEPARKRARIRKFPFVQQIDEMDCGAAALAMICRHFGRNGQPRPDPPALFHVDRRNEPEGDLRRRERARSRGARSQSDRPQPHGHAAAGDRALGGQPLAGPVRRRTEVRPGRRSGVGHSTHLPRGVRGELDRVRRAVRLHGGVRGGAGRAGRGVAWLKPFFTPYRAVFLQVFLLAGIVSVLQLLFPIFTQVVVDRVIVEQDLGLLNVIAIGMLVSLAFMMVSNLAQQYLLSFAAVRIDSAMLDLLTRKLLALPMSYFNNRRTGDIQRRLAGASQVRQFAVQHGIGGALAVVSGLGALALMAIYSPSSRPWSSSPRRCTAP